MARPPYRVRPETAVLTRGFDPRLSVGSARPPVYRTSTFVFSSPEAAERAFAIALGKLSPDRGRETSTSSTRGSRTRTPRSSRTSSFRSSAARGAAAVFNSGMAAIATCCFAFLPRGSALAAHAPALRRHAAPRAPAARAARLHGGRRAGRRSRRAGSGRRRASPTCKLVFVETPANPTLRMTDIAHAVEVAAAHPARPLVAVDNTFLGPSFQHPLALGADLAIYSATKFLGGHQRHARRRRARARRSADPASCGAARAVRQHPAGRRVAGSSTRGCRRSRCA